jgi:nucleotide-binding universal stress UspA family protein
VFETILVATDGSRAADQAVDWAAELAKGQGATLLICMATNQQLTTPSGPEPDHVAEDKLAPSDAGLGFGAEVLRRAEHVAKAAGINYELCEVYGHNIGATIVKEAEARGADHMGVGSTGRTELSRLLLGSVSQAVVRHAHCPVTVVR